MPVLVAAHDRDRDPFTVRPAASVRSSGYATITSGVQIFITTLESQDYHTVLIMTDGEGSLVALYCTYSTYVPYSLVDTISYVRSCPYIRSYVCTYLRYFKFHQIQHQ